MTKKKILSLSALLSIMILGLVYGQVYGWEKGFSYHQPTNLPAAYGKLYFSGQPAPADFKNLREKGFGVVINIRGPEEMTFDEKAVVEHNGMSYYNIPLLTDGQIMNPAVTRIFTIIKDNNGKKILLHCTSGNRVASWFGATLVQNLGYSRHAAIKRAEKNGMTNYHTEKTLKNYLDNLPQ